MIDGDVPPDPPPVADGLSYLDSDVGWEIIATPQSGGPKILAVDGDGSSPHWAVGSGGGGGAVTSVFGRTGNVIGNQSDIAGLTAALASKQDAATAATDIELAAEASARVAADSALSTAIGTKQDASTAATDTELAAEASARAAAVTGEANTRATADTALDGRLTAIEARPASVYRGAWQPSTAYAVNDEVSVWGKVWRRTIAGTSGSAFVASNNWLLVAGDYVFNVQHFGAGGGGVTNNTSAIRDALAAITAQAASNTRLSSTLYFPKGHYLCDFIGHAPILAPVTIPSSGSYTLSIDPTVIADNGYAIGNSLTLTDPQYDSATTVGPTVTGIVIDSISGSTVTVHGGQVAAQGHTYPAGCVIGKAGVDEGQILFDLSSLPNCTVVIDEGAVIDVSRAVAYAMGDNGVGYATQVFACAPTQSATFNYMPSSLYPGQQYFDVGSAAQPNPADGSGAGNTFALDDVILIGTNQYTGFDRQNAGGEIVHCAVPNDFASRINADIDSSQTSLVSFTILGNRSPADPNNATTTLTGGGINSTDTVAAVADARLLPNHTLAMIGSEVVCVRWDRTDETKIILDRGLHGTTAASHAASVAVNAIAAVRIDSEIVYYRDIAVATFSTLTRGAAGTTAAAHLQNAQIIPVPPPGRVFCQLPIQGGPYYAGGPDLRSTLQTACDASQITLEGQELADFPLWGIVQIDSEQIAYRYSSIGRLHECVRGYNGTTAATHAAGALIKTLPVSTTLTADITSGSSTAQVQVADGSRFRRVGDNFIKVDNEIILAKSGPQKQTALTATLDSSQTSVTTTGTFTNYPTSNFVIEVEQEHIFVATRSGNDFSGMIRGWDGTTANAHTSKACWYYYGFSLNSTSSVCRGRQGTTGASHSTGATVTQIDGSFAQKLTMTNNIHVRGPGTIQGAENNLSRVLYQTGLGASAGSRQTAFEFDFVRNFSVVGVRLFHCERGGVEMRSSIDGEVTGNTIEGCNRQGWGNSTDVINACQDIRIHHNMFRNCRHGGIASSASNGYWGAPRRIKFDHNHVEFCINGGWESQDAAEDVEVSFNEFISTPGVTVAISNSSTNVIGNTIRNSLGDAIQLANLTNQPVRHVVTNNTIVGAKNRGIYVFNESGDNSFGMMRIRSLIIANNQVHDVLGQAIAVICSAPAANYKIRNVQIHSNTVGGRGDSSVGGGAGSKARIALQNVASCTVKGNHLIDTPAPREAIWGQDATNCLIEGNLCEWRGTGTANGIAIEATVAGKSTGNSIIGNRINGALVGVALDNNTQNTKVRWNDPTGSATAYSLGTDTTNVLGAALADFGAGFVNSLLGPTAGYTSSALPTGATAGAGVLAFVTDIDGGTLVRSLGTATGGTGTLAALNKGWAQLSLGLTGTTTAVLTDLQVTQRKMAVSARPGNRGLPLSQKGQTLERASGLINTTATNLHGGSGFASGDLLILGVIWLPDNVTLTKIKARLGTTAVATPTHQWCCAIAADLSAILGKTNDDTTTAWAAQTAKEFTLTTPYLNNTGADIQVILALSISAGTMPSLITGQGATAAAVLAAMADAPAVAGCLATGKTDPASLVLGDLVAPSGNNLAGFTPYATWS